MKPSYALLKAGHYSPDYAAPTYLSDQKLYAILGYEQAALPTQNPAYYNTGAIRMSLALLKVGLPLTGRLLIKAGSHKGRFLECGAKRLADQLASPHALGKPEVFTDVSKRRSAIGARRGVLLFQHIAGYEGGYIDLVEPANADRLYHAHGAFNCRETWFWPLV